MKEVKEIEKYVKEKIIIEQKEEKEIKSQIFKRKKNQNNGIFNMDITILLFKEKIKIKIKEIQDNLKNNPILYESDFVMEVFGKLSDYYKNEGGIKSIYEFLVPIFAKGNNDQVIKKENKIIINVKYTFGNKEDEINFEIFKKEIGLKYVLSNIDKTLKEINKNNIETKNEFKKDLLEKVYPIGSYYWSEKNKSPENIFGGGWTKIEGKFLFASNSNYNVGQTGGEERHKLTADEMPNHSHGYDRIRYDFKEKGGFAPVTSFGLFNDYCPCNDKNQEFYSNTNTSSTGGSNYHNNMPPYLVANCWKRIR